MDSVVSQLPGPVVERIANELESFVNNKFHEIFGVESKIEDLSTTLRTIMAALEDSERLLLDSESRLLHDWHRKLHDVVLDAEDVLATFATEVALREKQRFPAPLAWLRFRSKAASKVEVIVKRMDAISKEKHDFHFRETDYVNISTRPHTARDSLVEVREMHCLRDTSQIISREEEKEEIVRWLLSDGSNPAGVIPVLAITGMGGVGKTTLAQLVYHDLRVYKKASEQSHFKAAVWVNVSTDCSVERILRETVEILTGMSHDKMPQFSIKERLLEVLEEKRLLLLLDDVWPEKFAWKPLSRFLRLCRGCKVLVTSRNEDVAKKMGAAHTLRLDLMSEEACWDLFVKRAFVTGECPRDLEEIGRKIVHRCQFLPLAVKAMACLLCGDTSVDNWKKIMKSGAWGSDLHSDSGNDTYILPALKLSYDHLRPQLKQCFAYCSIFPKGYMFDQNELVKLWIAEGYIQPGAGADKVEEVGGRYFNELLKRSFFQPLEVNNTKRCKMHDLYHDLAKSVSSFCQQVEENESLSIKAECRHMSFLGKEVERLAEKILNAPKLRTLLLPTTHAKNFGKMLHDIFRTLSYLRVLDLSSSTIEDLPDSIGELKLLAYLDLSRTEIKALPSMICNLLNLQVLKLLGCLWLWELPKDLRNLTKLRYLELDDMFWYKRPTLPAGIGGLTHLHNLHFFHVGSESGYGIEEFKSMNNLQGNLHISNLGSAKDAKSAALKQKEGISGMVLEWNDEEASLQEMTAQERVLEDLEPHHGLERLQINHFKGNQFPSWLGILSNLQNVSLNQCMNCKVLSLGPLPHLWKLSIKGMPELVGWPEEAYPSLTRLTISNCPQLKELPCMFPNLRTAKIKQCDALTSLPVMPYLGFLRIINNASLENWSEIFVGVITRDDRGRQVSEVRSSLMNLLELKVINCPRFQTLPKGFAPQKLVVSGCTSLRSLPDAQHSKRLHGLELEDCIGPSLIEAIPSTESLSSLVISNVKYMYSLPQLPNLPGLKTLYIDNCQDLISLSYADGWVERLPALQFLFISGCRKLEAFPGEDLPSSIQCLSVKNCTKLRAFCPGNCLARLTSLKDLYLEDCPRLVGLPKDGLPSSLKHLCIQGCPLLTQKCSQGGRYWPMIRHVADSEIEFVKPPEPQGPLCPRKRKFWML